MTAAEIREAFASRWYTTPGRRKQAVIAFRTWLEDLAKAHGGEFFPGNPVDDYFWIRFESAEAVRAARAVVRETFPTAMTWVTIPSDLFPCLIVARG